MTDLERLYRRLVKQLAATDPARLHRPLPLDEIVHSLIPYRANRRVLGVDTSEEYEVVLMRLCAGEGGLVRTEPEDARTRFAEELESANPDLAALHSFEIGAVTLRPEPLARALGSADTELESDPPALPEPPAPARDPRAGGARRAERRGRARSRSRDDPRARAGDPMRLLRRPPPDRPRGQLLSALRPEPDDPPLSRVPHRSRARVEALRELRARGERGVSA